MESVNTPVKTLGVTGGIGSGKSAVCKEFEELGAAIFSADQVAKHIMVNDPGARLEIIQAFGEESYLPDGILNRAYLAKKVFGDEAHVATINGIVHPRVFQAFQEQKKHCKTPLLIHEAALIFESGGYKHLDAVLVVHAPIEIRIQRVMARDGSSRQQVLDRMAHQLPPEELLRRADYVIENDSDLDTLTHRVQDLYNQMTSI